MSRVVGRELWWPVLKCYFLDFSLYLLSTIENLGGKQLVMQLLAHEDPNVRYEALLAVQKLMVHNWEYLGKQLEKDKEGGVTKMGGAPVKTQ